MNVYAIEYEMPAKRPGLRFGHTYETADTAKAAVEKFCEEHPDAEIRELRRVHA